MAPFFGFSLLCAMRKAFRRGFRLSDSRPRVESTDLQCETLETRQMLAAVTLEFDASQDVGGDSVWTATSASTSTNPDAQFNFRGGQTPSPADVSATSNVAGITHAYDFGALGGNEVRFGNGTSDSIHDVLGDAVTKQDATFELWFRTPDFTDTHNLFDTGGNGSGLVIELIGSTLQARFQDANNDADRIVLSHTFDDPADLNVFHQVVLTVQPGSPALGVLYVDGIERANSTTDDLTGPNNITDWDGGDIASLGSNGSNTPAPTGTAKPNLNGDIAIFRFYANQTLNADEVLDSYNRLTNDTIVYLDSNEDLVIEDVNTATDDRLTFSTDGTNLTITDTSGASIAGLGIPTITGNGTSTVTIPLAAWTGNIHINLGAGTDEAVLTSSLSSLPAGRTVSVGGGDSSDLITVESRATLTIQGGVTIAENIALYGTLANIGGSNTLTGTVTTEGTTAAPYALLDFGTGNQRTEPDAIAVSSPNGNDNTNNNVTAALVSQTGDAFGVAVSRANQSGTNVGNIDWRDRGNSTVNQPLVQLGEDHVKNNSGIIRVTLSSLPAGHYKVTSYHEDASFGQAQDIRVFVQEGATFVDTGRVGSDINPDSGNVNTLSTATMESGAAEFYIYSNGVDSVAIIFDATGSTDKEVPLSGLRLEALGPTILSDAAGETLNLAGPTVLNTGLQIDGAGITSLSGSVTVNGQSIRKLGSGTLNVASATTLSDVLVHGGILAATSSGVAIGAAQTLTIPVHGATAPGTDYGYLSIRAGASLDITDVELALKPSFYTISSGDSFTIVENDGTLTGRFVDEDGNTLEEGDTFFVNGVALEITYQGGDGDDVVVSFDNTPVLQGTSGDDVFTIIRDGTDVLVTNATTGDSYTLAIATVDSLTINGGDGNDLLTVDFSQGSFGFEIRYNGQGDPGITPGDTLSIVGGTFTDVVLNHTNASDGSVMLDSELISYTGLEPVDVGVSGTNLVVNLTDGADETTFTLIDADGDSAVDDLFIDSVNGSHEVDTVLNINSFASIIVNAGNGDDLLTFGSTFSSTTGFQGDLEIYGDGNDDTVQFDGTLDLASLSVIAESIVINQSVTTTGGDQIYDGDVDFASSLTLSGADIRFRNGTTVIDGVNVTFDASGTVTSEASNLLDFQDGDLILANGTVLNSEGTAQVRFAGTMEFRGSGTFNNLGTFNQIQVAGGTDDNLEIFSGFTFNNAGVYDFQGQGDLRLHGGSVFNNTGTLTKSVSGSDPSFIFGTSGNSGDFNNLASGIVSSTAGRLNIATGGTSDAAASWIGDGANVQISGFSPWTGVFNGYATGSGHVAILDNGNGTVADNFIVGAGGVIFNITGEGVLWNRSAIDTTSGDFVNAGFMIVEPGGLKNLAGGNQLVVESGGTLLIAGGGVTPIDGSSVRIASGGTLAGGGLGGTGTGIMGPVIVEIGGLIAPGDTNPDTLDLGDLTINGEYNVDIVDPVTFDQLSVNGDVILGATSTIQFAGSYVPVSGDVFTLISSNGTITGNFSNLPDGGAVSFNGAPLSASYAGGDLVLTFDPTPTIVGTAADDDFVVTLSADGTEVVVTRTTGGVTTEQRFDWASLTGLTVNGGDGNDTLTVDYSNGLFGFEIAFHGEGDTGAAPGDTLSVIGGSFTDVTLNHTNATDGSVVLDSEVVSYTGLEPVLVGVGGTNLIVNLTSGIDQTQFSLVDGDADSAVDDLFIESINGSHEDDTVLNIGSYASIVVNAGDGNDDLTFASDFSSALGFQGSLDVQGENDSDAVDFTGVVNLTDLTVSAETIDLAADVNTAGAQSFTGAVNINGDLVLNTNVATANGTLTIAGTLAGNGNDLTIQTGTGTGSVSGTATGIDLLSIPESGTITFASGLAVDSLLVAEGGNTASLAVTSGTVTVGNGDADDDFIVARNLGNVGSGSISVGTVDFTGATAATINVDDLFVGVKGDTQNGVARGVVTLATNNAITADVISIGRAGNNGGSGNELHLGSGLNTILASSIIVGSYKGAGLLDVAAGGTVEIGTAANRTALEIGLKDASTGIVNTSVVDFSNGSATIFATSITLGRETTASAGHPTGRLILADATVDVSGNLIEGGATGDGSSELIVVGDVDITVGGDLDLDLVRIGQGTVVGDLALNVAGTAQTRRLLVRTNNTANNVLSIGAGQTLTVDGDFLVGVPGTTGQRTNLIASGGTLNVTGSQVEIGLANSNQDSAANLTTVDLSGLASFQATVSDFRVGFGSRNGAALTLSDTANVITANVLTIGDSANNNASPASVILGAGTNVIHADTIDIGRGKGNAALEFASQTAGSSGTLEVRAQDGVGGADFNIGRNTVIGTGATIIGLLDLRGHVVDVLADTMNLAMRSEGGNGGIQGRIFFDAGTFTTNALIMSDKDNGSGAGVAELNIGGGTFTVNAGGTFTLADHDGGAAASGTVNLTGGTLISNVDILDLGGDSSTSIIVQGGTLDMTGHAIGGATPIDVLVFESGTVQNIGEINAGTTALVKSGPGTLILDGVNTYSGGTSVDAGILQLASDEVIPDGPGVGNLNIAASGTLNLNGISETINGLTGSGVVDATAVASALRIGANDTSSTFAGTFNGSTSFTLEKIGTGTFTLTDATNLPNLMIELGVVALGDATAGQTFVLDPTETLSILLGGTTAATEHGQVSTNADTFAFDDATLDLSLTGGFIPDPSDGPIVLVNNISAGGPTTDRFRDSTGRRLEDGYTVFVGGYAFQIEYDGGDGNDVVLLYDTTPVVTATDNDDNIYIYTDAATGTFAFVDINGTIIPVGPAANIAELTVDGLGGSDQIFIEQRGQEGQLEFVLPTGSLTIIGGAGNDTVYISDDVDLGGSLSIDAESIVSTEVTGVAGNTSGELLIWDASDDATAGAIWWSDSGPGSENDRWQVSGGATRQVVNDGPFSHAYQFGTGDVGYDHNNDGNANDSFQDSGLATNADATWEFWLRIPSGLTNQAIWESGGGGDGSSLIINSSGELQFTVKNNNGDGGSLAVVAPYPADEFFQVAIVYDRDNPGDTDTLRIYINGVLIPAATVQNTTTEDWDGGDDAALGSWKGSIGANGANGVNQNVTGDFTGEIALFRFYESKALSDTEVENNYSATITTTRTVVTAGAAGVNLSGDVVLELDTSIDSSAGNGDITADSFAGSQGDEDLSLTAGTGDVIVGTPAPIVFVQDAQGRVVGEAEHFSDRNGNGTQEWLVVPTESSGAGTFTNARGGAYVQSLPDDGTSGGPLNTPEILYTFTVTTADTYRLFLRWDGRDGSSDSIFADIVELKDGTGGSIADWYEFQQGTNTDFANAPWDGGAEAEANEAGPSNNPATWFLNPGTYTLRFTEREDGVAVDAWVIQPSSLTAPTGFGPDETLLSSNASALDNLGDVLIASAADVALNGSVSAGSLTQQAGTGDTSIDGPLTLTGALDITTSGTFNVNGDLTAQTATITAAGGTVAGDVSLPGQLTADLDGSLALVGQNHNFGADIIVLDGTVAVAGSGGTTTVVGSILLGNSVDATAEGAFRVSGHTVTAATVDDVGPAATDNTSGLFVDGGSLTLSTGLDVDQLTVADNASATLTVSAGDVRIGQGSDDLIIARSSSSATTGIVDFTAASSVTIDVTDIEVGFVGTSSNVGGLLQLSTAGVNVVSATTITLSNSNSAGINQDSVIELGVDNTFNVNTFFVGRRKGQGIVRFQVGVTGGTFNLSGDSNAQTDLYLGFNDVDTGTIALGLVDLVDPSGGVHVFNANIDDLILGRHNEGNGAGQGTLLIEAGTVLVDDVLLGHPNANGTSNNPTDTFGRLELHGGDATTRLDFRFDTISKDAAAGASLVLWRGGTLGNLVGEAADITGVNLTLNGENLADPRVLNVSAGQVFTVAAIDATASVSELDSSTTDNASLNNGLIKTGGGELVISAASTALDSLTLFDPNDTTAESGFVTVGDLDFQEAVNPVLRVHLDQPTSGDSNAATPGVDYGQIRTEAGAAHTVDLTGVTLSVTRTASFFPSTLNNSGPGIVLINNQNAGSAVVGKFVGLAEGAQVIVNGLVFEITYEFDADTNTRGGGNDVALVVSNNPIIIDDDTDSDIYIFNEVDGFGTEFVVVEIDGTVVFRSQSAGIERLIVDGRGGDDRFFIENSDDGPTGNTDAIDGRTNFSLPDGSLLLIGGDEGTSGDSLTVRDDMDVFGIFAAFGMETTLLDESTAGSGSLTVAATEQVYFGDVLLGADINLDGARADFGGTVDSQGSPHDLVLNTTESTVFRASVGDISPLNSITTPGGGETLFLRGDAIVGGVTLDFDAGDSTNATAGQWAASNNPGEHPWTIPGGITLNSTADSLYDGLTGSYTFDGTSGMTAATYNGFGDQADFTLEFWIKPDQLSFSDPSNPGQLIWEAGGSGQGASLVLRPGSSPGQATLKFTIKTGGGANDALTVEAPLLQNLEFTHVAVVYDRNAVATEDQLRIYVDGVLLDSDAVTGADDWTGGDGAGLGYRSSTTNTNSAGGQDAAGVGFNDFGSLDPFAGEIAVVRYYSGQAFTRAQVLTNLGVDRLAVDRGPISVNTLGDQFYSGTVTTNDSLTLASLAGTVSLNNDTLALSGINGDENITIVGQLLLNGALNQVASLEVFGDATISTPVVETINASGFVGDVVLTEDVLFRSTDVRFYGRVDSDATPRALSVEASGDTLFGGHVGRLSPLASVSADAPGRVLFGNVDSFADARLIYDAANAGNTTANWFSTGTDTDARWRLASGTTLGAVTSDQLGLTSAYDFTGASGPAAFDTDLAGANSQSFEALSGNPSDNDAVWEFWLEVDSAQLATSPNQVIWEAGGGADGSSLVIRDLNGDGTGDSLQFTVKNGGGSLAVRVPLPADLSDFFHVMIVYDRDGTGGDLLNMYINGVDAGQIAGGMAAATGLTNVNDWAGGNQAGLGDLDGDLGANGAEGLVLGDFADFQGRIAVMRFDDDRTLGSGQIRDAYLAGAYGNTVDIVTVGDQTYLDIAVAQADLTLEAGGDVTFGQTLDAATPEHDLIVSAPGTTTFTDDVGASGAFATISSAAGGETVFGGDVDPVGTPTLNFDASALNNTDKVWLDSQGQVVQWSIPGSGGLVSVTSGRGGITHAYDFSSIGTGSLDTGNGGDAFQELPGNASDESATFEFWLRAADLGGNPDQIIWETGGSGDGSSLVIRNGNTLQFTIKNQSNAFSVSAALPADATAEFFQVAVTYDRNNPNATDTLRMFINRVEVAGSPATSSNVDDYDGGDAAGLGGSLGTLGGENSEGLVAANFSGYSGQIAVMRFYQGIVLSDGEIAQAFSQVATPTPSPITVNSVGQQTYDDAVILAADVTFNASGVAFNTIDGTTVGEQSLTVNSSGNGVNEFLADIGSTTALADITTNADGSVVFSGSSVTTTGSQTYNEQALLANDLTLNAGGDVTFGQTVDSQNAAVPQSLDVIAAGTTTFGSDVGSTGILESLLTSGGGTTILAQNLGGGLTTVHTVVQQDYQDSVVLAADATLTASDVTFGHTLDGDGTPTTGADLVVSLYDDGAVIFQGPVGSVDPLESSTIQSLTDSANAVAVINGGSVNTVGLQAYTIAVELGADTVTASLGGGDILFEIIGGNGNSLIVNTSGVTYFSGSVSDVNNLVTDGPGATDLGNITVNVTNATWNDPVLLSGNAVVTAANQVTFAQTIDSGPATSFDLAVIATSATLAGDIGLVSPIGELSVDVQEALQLAISILSVGDISLTIQDDANESGDTDDGLTLSAGTIQSLAGGITVDADDFVIVAANSIVQAFGDVNIAVDTGPADGTGAVVSVEGQVISDTGVIQVVTGDDADQIRYNDERPGFASLLIQTAGGNDTVNLVGTAASGTAFVETGLGDDTIRLGSDASSLDSLQGMVVTIQGGADSDSLTFADEGDTDANSYLLTNISLARNSATPFAFYESVEQLALNTGSGADAIGIQSTSATTSTSLNSGSGDDVVTLGAGSSLLDQIAGSMQLEAGAGTDALLLDDTSSINDKSGQLSAVQISGLGLGGQVDYTSFESLGINLGGGNDLLTATSTHAGATAVNTGAGDDTFAVGADSLRPVVVTLSDPSGSDTLDFDGSREITIDLDQTSAQKVNARGDTLTVATPFENFTGSPFDDTIYVDPLATAARLIRGQSPQPNGPADGNGNFAPGDTLFIETFGSAFSMPRTGGDGQFTLNPASGAPSAGIDFTSIERVVFQSSLDLRGLPLSESPGAGVPVETNLVPRAEASLAATSEDAIYGNSDGLFRTRGKSFSARGDEAIVLVVLIVTPDGLRPVASVGGSTVTDVLQKLQDLHLANDDYLLKVQAGESEFFVEIPPPEGEEGTLTDEQIESLKSELDDEMNESGETDDEQITRAPASPSTAAALAAAIGGWMAARRRNRRTNWSADVERLMERLGGQ